MKRITCPALAYTYSFRATTLHPPVIANVPSCANHSRISAHIASSSSRVVTLLRYAVQLAHARLQVPPETSFGLLFHIGYGYLYIQQTVVVSIPVT